MVSTVLVGCFDDESEKVTSGGVSKEMESEAFSVYCLSRPNNSGGCVGMGMGYAVWHGVGRA
jgi:hypothetical protein